MASQVEICNIALQKLGAKRIQNISDDSNNARACNVAYVPMKLKLLRQHVWNFSVKRASLAADSPVPDFGRANSFQLPSDFVRLADPYPEDNNNANDWVIEGQKILTDDTAPLNIRYVYNVTDENIMDSLFRDLLSVELALQLCEELTQSNPKKLGLIEDRKMILAEARKANAFEKVALQFPEDEWITKRL